MASCRHRNKNNIRSKTFKKKGRKNKAKKSRKMKVGGQKPTPTDIRNAEELMFMMHEKKHKLAKKPLKDVPYDVYKINAAFKNLFIKRWRTAFYQSLENKSNELGL